MKVSRAFNTLMAIMASSTVLFGIAEAGLVSYFRGECDIICKRCKFECERLYKPGTWKRWSCKGGCKFNKTK